MDDKTVYLVSVAITMAKISELRNEAVQKLNDRTSNMYERYAAMEKAVYQMGALSDSIFDDVIKYLEKK